MKTRAAVAWKAEAPLTIETVDLDGPKAGEALIEIMATGVCHTDAYTLSGLDSEGKFPAILGHEGAGSGPRGRGRRDVGEAGRSCHPALHARMPAVQKLPVAADQSLHRDPRHPGPGPDAGRHQPLLLRGREQQAPLPLHGLLDLLQFHRPAGDRPRQGARGRALRQDLLHRLRRHHRHRRGGLYRQGLAGRQCRGVRPGRHRPQCDPGRADGRRRQDHRRRPQSRQSGHGQEIRHDPFRQPGRGRPRQGGAGDRRPHRRRRRFLVRVYRQCRHHAPGAGMLPSRLGRHRSSSASPAVGPGDRDPAVPARHRPGLARLGLRRRARPHRRAARSSTGTWRARSISTT